MESAPFSQRSLSRSTEPEPTDQLLRVTAPHEWMIVAGLVLSLAAAAAWGVFGRVEVSLMLDGVLVQPGERTPVVSAVSGRVLAVLVQPGDAVAERTRIALIEPAGLDAQVRIADATRNLLQGLLNRSGGPADPALQVALAVIRAEGLVLEALDNAGSAIVSSRSGEVSTTHVRVGDVVEAGATIAYLRHGAGGEVAAVAFLTAEQARTVRPGMPARVLVEAGPGGAPRALAGGIASVSGPVEFPAWLDGTPLAASWAHAGARGRLVTFSPAEPEELRGEDLRSCRLEIVLERVPPLALLASTRGAS